MHFHIIFLKQKKKLQSKIEKKNIYISPIRHLTIGGRHGKYDDEFMSS